MYVHTPVPQTTIDQLGEICFGLPEVYEESAWVGWRWMVRKNNFAHVLMIDKGYPPTYARIVKAAKADEPICVLTFRTPSAADSISDYATPPYFLPGWWPNIVGVIIDKHVDWSLIAEHINNSYRTLAPKKLIALL